MSRWRRRASTPSTSRSPSSRTRCCRAGLASRWFRIRPRWCFSQPGFPAAIPIWPRPATAPCRERSRHRPTSPKSRQGFSTPPRSLPLPKGRSAFLRDSSARLPRPLAQQRAMEHQAELNLEATRRSRPCWDGTVGVRTLRAGQYVQAGTQLMAVAPLQAVYVVANYKETQLTDVQPGQAVLPSTSPPSPALTCTALSTVSRPRAIKEFCAAAARQCNRQFHQDRPAHPGQDRDRPE